MLEKDGAEVQYHDPYVPEFSEDGHSYRSVELTDELLGSVDAAVILTDHSDFDYDQIVAKSNVLVDTRNATSKAAGVDVSDRPQRWIIKG